MNQNVWEKYTEANDFNETHREFRRDILNLSSAELMQILENATAFLEQARNKNRNGEDITNQIKRFCLLMNDVTDECTKRMMQRYH